MSRLFVGLLRRLYPAGYRAAHGEEIVAVFAESVQGADRRTAVREWAVLAAHALRLRTRLSSRDPAGRVLAGAAPFLVAGGAALGAVQLLTLLFERGPYQPPVALDVAHAAPWVLALLCAALGRWAPARVLVLLAVVAAQFGEDAESIGATSLLGVWAVVGALVLLAPPDAVDLSRRGRHRVVATATAVALPMSGIAVLWLGSWGKDSSSVLFPPIMQTPIDTSTAWPAVVLAVAYLLYLADPATDRLRAAGVALAALPWGAMVPPPLYRNAPAEPRDLLRDTVVVLVFLAAATVVGLRRRNRLAGVAGAPDPLA
ncbi:hypothetical protein ACFYS8_28075 [Kitasatospora sp. NPDC004615]|uniref:hypothetical protein n=1 Tax=Kitasatospora sp. NPDC004615 TaxID=3364017 RepID=UPI0036834679